MYLCSRVFLFLRHNQDPLLTPLGESQARNLSKAWVQAKADGIPLPTRWFCSPFRRTSKTCLLSWEGIFGGYGGEGKNVRVLENLREVCGSVRLLITASVEDEGRRAWSRPHLTATD